MTTGNYMPEDILGPYRLWRAAAMEFADASQRYLDHMTDADGMVHGEDLSDWVDSIRTLLSFSPNVPNAEDIPR